MVEQWELDWNSSMIKYGEDAGTLEYILAKGGNLSDVNYVMLDQQDSGWEPIIKAIAERDNSHPDIIRKNMQQPYGVDANYRPAVPMNVGGVQVAAQNKGQARQVLGAQRVNQANQNIESAQAAGQSPRGRDYAQTGQRLRGLMQGAKNIGREVLSPAYYGATDAMGRGIDRAGPAMAGAAKKVGGAVAGAAKAGAGAVAGAGRFLAEKFPGVKERMGNFVQGVGDVARYGREAYRGAKDESAARRQSESRRGALEGALGRMDTEMDNINRRYPENSPTSGTSRRAAIQDLANRYGKNFNIDSSKGNVQEAMRAELASIGADLQKPNKGAIGRALDMGRDKRESSRIRDELGALGLGQQPQAETENVSLPEETTAAVEEQMEQASPEANTSSMTDAKPEEQSIAGMPTTEEPEAPSPVPTAAPPQQEEASIAGMPTTADNNSTTGTFTGRDMAPMSPAEQLKYYNENIASHYAAEDAGQEYGSKDRRRQMARIHAGEEDFKPDSFPGRGQGLAASNMLQSLGIEMVQLGHAEDQQEAEEIIEDAQQGDAEASKKVQDTQNKVPAVKVGTPKLLSEDRLDSQWDALLKRLEVR